MISECIQGNDIIGNDVKGNDIRGYSRKGYRSVNILACCYMVSPFCSFPLTHMQVEKVSQEMRLHCKSFCSLLHGVFSSSSPLAHVQMQKVSQELVLHCESFGSLLHDVCTLYFVARKICRGRAGVRKAKVIETRQSQQSVISKL